MFSDLWTDVRYGLKLLAKSPAFTVTAIMTIALGIGPNTAMFCAMYTVFWAPSDDPSNGRTSVLRAKIGEGPPVFLTTREYLAWQRHSVSFELFTANTWARVTLNDDADYPERIELQSFTPGHIPMRGGVFTLGRDFRPEEAVAGGPPAAVLSNQFWQQRYHADPAIIGKQIRLDGVPHTIVGVLAPGWWDRRREPLWTSLRFGEPDSLDVRMLTVMAMRKPGVTNAQAQAELSTLVKHGGAATPSGDLRDADVTEARSNWGNERTNANLYLLMATVSLVLLIACLNVANLLLARGGARQRELAVRVSLGATRSRIIRQLLTESLALSILGGLLGVALASALLHVFLQLMPPFSLPVTRTFSLRPEVLLFTLGTTIASGLLFGVAPAWQMMRLGLAESMKQGGRSGVGRGRRHVGKVLVVGEFALALTLLAGAGMVMQSYWSRINGDFGIRTENVLTFDLPVQRSRFRDDASIREYNSALVGRIRAVPGVLHVTALSGLPLASAWNLRVVVAQKAPSHASQFPIVKSRMVGPGFLKTFGAQLRAGREFGPRDRPDGMRVALVNETFVRQYLDGVDPLGQELIHSRERDMSRIQIVGVYGNIANAEQFGDPPLPEVLLSLDQVTAPHATYAIRTNADPRRVERSIAASIREIEPGIPMTNVKTMEDVIRDRTAFERVEVILYGSFAALAVLLAAVGVYGLMTFLIQQRTAEFGIRTALGASSGKILRLVFIEGLKLAVAGIVLGAAGAWYGSRVLQATLYAAGKVDPLMFAAVTVVLLGTATIGCVLPARRAAKVDPLTSLRAE
jgi:putative ABC transport system permease protein